MKYADLLRTKLGVEAQKLDEIECVVRGCNFLLNHIPDEAFSFEEGFDSDFFFCKIKLFLDETFFREILILERIKKCIMHLKINVIHFHIYW